VPTVKSQLRPAQPCQQESPNRLPVHVERKPAPVTIHVTNMLHMRMPCLRSDLDPGF
jgi:hypothetical protein